MEDKNSIAWDLIQDRNALISKLLKVVVVLGLIFLLTIMSIVGAFIWYLNQYNFSSTTTTYTAESTSEGEGDANAFINEEGLVMIDGESTSDSY